MKWLTQKEKKANVYLTDEELGELVKELEPMVSAMVDARIIEAMRLLQTFGSNGAAANAFRDRALKR